MRIKKILDSVGLVGNVLNQKSSSKKDAYSCDYVNKLGEVKQYEIVNAPAHSSGTNKYNLRRVGNIAILNSQNLWANKIPGNEWLSLGNIPNEITPSIDTQTNATISDGGNGEIVGYGKVNVKANGLLELRSNKDFNNTNLCSINFSISWIIDK